MTDIALKLQNISKTFYVHEDKKTSVRQMFVSLFNQGRVKAFKALDDINIEIKQGEFLGIVGKNGSGKSTLLKIIAGIYQADKGGRVIANGSIVPFLELGVGFNPDLTGKENIYLNGLILGMTRAYINQQFNEIVKFAELEEFINEPVKNYSSGMMVRLAFSIAIQSDADIYILDEILAVGDLNFQRKSLAVFNDLKKRGKTVLFVSHALEAIEQYCDRAILIDDHKLIADGTPADIAAKYRKILNPVVQEETDDKEKPGDRWGTQDAVITKVEFVGKKGELKIYDKTEEINILIDIRVKKAIEDFVIGMSIHSMDDRIISGTNSQIKTQKKPTKPGDYKMSISLPAKFFLDGEYQISIAAFDITTMTHLDYHYQMYPFKVNNDVFDTGAVSLPVVYEFGEEESEVVK